MRVPQLLQAQLRSRFGYEDCVNYNNSKKPFSFSSGHLNLTFSLCFQPPTMRRTAMNARCDSSRATRPKTGSSSRAAVPVPPPPPPPPTEDHLPRPLLPPHHHLLHHQDETQLNTALPTVRPHHPQVAAAAATVTAIEAAPATVDLRARRTLPRPLLPPPLHCPFRPIRRIETITTTTC